MYICPICRKNLKLSENSYKCKNNHCFDIAKNGYVNLLTTKGRNPKLAGDNQQMVKARTDFLDKKYYLKLAEKTGEIIKNLLRGIGKPIIIDSGCGEGFYTANYAKSVPNAEIYGIDISKNAVSHCMTRCNSQDISNASFAVASSFELPFRELYADLIVCTFAPVTNDEYARVLKKSGKLVVVSPSARHLFGLKEVLYDEPYENKPNAYGLKKFVLEDEIEFNYEINLASNEDIQNLFTMTPYYYKTSEQAKEKLSALDSLKTECGFTIQTYRKK